MKAFPVIKDLVTDVSKQRSEFQVGRRIGSGETGGV